MQDQDAIVAVVERIQALTATLAAARKAHLDARAALRDIDAREEEVLGMLQTAYNELNAVLDPKDVRRWR